MKLHLSNIEYQWKREKKWVQNRKIIAFCHVPGLGEARKWSQTYRALFFTSLPHLEVSPLKGQQTGFAFTGSRSGESYVQIGDQDPQNPFSYVQKHTGRGSSRDLTLPCSSSDISSVCSTRNEPQGLLRPERELPRRRHKPYLQLIAIIHT